MESVGNPGPGRKSMLISGFGSAIFPASRLMTESGSCGLRVINETLQFMVSGPRCEFFLKGMIEAESRDWNAVWQHLSRTM